MPGDDNKINSETVGDDHEKISEAGKAYESEINFDNKRSNTSEERLNELVYFSQRGYFGYKKLPAFNLTKDVEFVKSHPDFKGHITKQILEDYIRKEILGNDPEKAGA